MGLLPSGLVTFMFTDIEGSTRLHQRLADRYATLLALHDRLLGEVVATHDGVVVTSMGDGIFAAFGDAARAVDAAADVQRVLARQAWPDRAELLVRVGLHCGSAQPRDGNYVALAVHRAARVAGAAYGGQVLATADVVDVVPDPACGEWADLGAYRLKDFDEPVQLFEMLDGSGACRSVAGTRAMPAATHNVPEFRSSFIGRDAELAELAALLVSGARLVSVLGPGGVGKTRLAFELVRAVSGSHADGAWVVLLANASNAQDLDDRLLRTLHIPERGNMTARETVLAALQPRDSLLMLDNTEQISDDAAVLVRQLLDVSPRLKVLVTSRQPLGLAGEVTWRLAPLPVTTRSGGTGASVDLFVERATARNPKLSFSATDEEVIAHICRQVDGLPLAIELAAGRLRHMGLRDLAARLQARLRASAFSDPDVDDRQRTMSALVDWSYQLLTTSAQMMLRQMSVLQGPAPLEAVEALTDNREDPAEALAELVDKSLVIFGDDADRPYRMLVTIRHFAQQQLGGEEGIRTRRRHAQYHLNLAREIFDGLEGRDAPRWLNLADLAHDDLAAAMAFAESEDDGETLAELAHILANCLFDLGRYTEGGTWLTRAAQVSCRPAARARVLSYRGFLLGLQGDAEHGKQSCEEAVDLALETADPDGVAEARQRLANVLTMSGDFLGAQGQIESALNLPIAPLRRARLMEMRGAVAHLEGKYEAAIDDYRRAHEVFDSVGYVIGIPNALTNMGEALVQSGRLDEAEIVLTKALDLTAAEQKNSVTYIYLYLGKLCAARGDAGDAATWASKALTLARGDGHALAIREIEGSGLI